MLSPSSTPAGFVGRGDGPGWEPDRSPVGGPFVWEIAELLSANSAHPAVIFNWEAWRAGRWVYRATPVTAPGYWARMLCNDEQEPTRQQGRRGGV